MKYLIAAIFVLGTVGIIAFGAFAVPGATPERTPADFLRLHIFAHSDQADDQAVKYEVRGAIINAMTPVLANVTSRDGAMAAVNSNLALIERVSNQTLYTSGFDYTATVSMGEMFFPTRAYNGHVLPYGVYKALQIRLGDGTGANWWSVVYPPLCFLDNNIGGDRGVVYRSRINEIIRRFFA